MPPLKGIDRGINGELLKALEETGHGDRIVVVDPSYSIPDGANMRDYQGDSTARALKGILDLVPSEEGLPVTIMTPDVPRGNEPGSLVELYTAVQDRDDDIKVVELPRLSEHALDGTGFYDLVNDLEVRPSLFVRTRDKLPYACATFIVGHSQVSKV